jgi:ATP-dependent Clp protease ATP-binding subunit ClpA
VRNSPALAPDAAIVLGIASTALPFACTPEDGAERWLRVLRMHGEAGAALQALGVSEGPLRTSVEDERPRAQPAGADDRDAVARVLENAAGRADRRGADGVATSDVLMAVMDVYGADFERVLRAHGTDRDEVIEQLATTAAYAA